MKQIIKQLMAVAILFSVALSGYAYDFEVDGIFYGKNSDGKTVYVTSSSVKYSGSVVIPSEVSYGGTNYSVTEIGEDAFYRCSGLTSVTIPNSVTSISKYAFQMCSGMTKVEISDIAAWCNISFGDNPLKYAHHIYLNGTEVTNLVIPNSVTSISDYAFSDCTGLTSVTIGNSITSIGDYAFYNCSGLTSITIPNSVTSIGRYAFYNCSGLTSVTIGNSVTLIGDYALSGTAWYDNQSDGLIYAGKVAYKYKGKMPDNTSITLNDGTIGIASSAFYNCRGLTSVTIPNSVTEIGDWTFYNCSGLTSVTIPNSVTEIGRCAFNTCSGLKSVSIPESITSISEYAFEDCSGLTSVSIPNSVTSIGSSAFRNCSGLTSVTIPNSVTTIGESAFSGCSGLTSVIIPESVTEIGVVAFVNCTGLTSIVFNAKNCTTMGTNAYAVFKDCTNVSSLTIGDNVEAIPSSTFSGCSGLTSVTIPNSVTSIGDYTFVDCSGLTSVTIGNSVTSIGDWTFSRCSGLTSVTIGNSVTSIGEGAFYNCSGLTSVIFNAENCEAMGDSNFPVFGGSTNLTSITIGNKVKTVPNYAFMKCNGLTSIDIPISVKSIGDMAFSGCNLTKVTCRATLPPTISETTFSQNVYDDATLYVYANSEDYYRDDEYWQNFYNVQTLSGGSVIEPVQLSVLFPDRGKVAIDVPYNKAVTLTVFPNGVAGFGLSSATFNGVEIFDELDENYRYTTPVLTENAVLSVVYVSVPSGVDQSLANRIKVSASNGTVRVMGAAPESEVLVCDLSGKIVRKSAEKTFTLGEGIYVLNVEGLSFKFAM